jgi:hypothetical protein
MRLAIYLRTLSLLALPAVLATCALAQDQPNAQPSALRDQLAKQAAGAPKPKPAAPKAPASKAPGAKPPSAPAKNAMPKAAAKQAPPKAAKPAAEKPVTASVTRRDPFDTLLNKAKPGNAPAANLPPGKAGLVVGTLRIDGIIHDPMGMIAIVSNPQQRVYFLREGDKLYDGSVEHITLEAISFHEIGKDAFGKPLEREVTKRLFPSPGE